MSARVIKRLLWAAAVLAAYGLLVPTAAPAHAVLQQTEPARGATAEQAPEQVSFRFSEAVEASFGAVRVFNADGQRVDTGEAFRPGGRSSAIATRPKAGLPDGSYTATYRVISADSHPVSGGFVFSVGTAGAGPAQTVSALVDQGNAGPVTEIAFGVVRFLDYAAIALAIGLLAFLAFVWRPALAAVAGGDATWRAASEAYVRRVRTIMVAALGAGLVSGALGIVLQGATAAGVSFWAALDRTIVGEVLDTRFGTVWGARLIAWAALGVALFALRRTVSVPALRPAQLGATGLALVAPARAWRVALLLIPLAFLAVSPALAGHASTQSPQLLLVPTDVIHVVAMSVWLAGLALIVFALPIATRRLESDDRGRLLAATLTRFSPIALAAVAALLTSGLVQSFVHVRSLDNVAGTAFGRAALIKLWPAARAHWPGRDQPPTSHPAPSPDRRGRRPAGRSRAAVAQDGTRRGGVDRGGAGRHRGAGQLRAADGAQLRAVLDQRTSGTGSARDDRGPIASRRQRDPPLSLRRRRRQPVHEHPRARRAAVPARQGHRTAERPAPKGRPRPLRRPSGSVWCCRQLAGQGDQPGLGLRRIHDDDRRADRMRPLADSTPRTLALILAVAAATWTLLLGATGVETGLLFLAPALLIAIPLLGGRYPGEQVLDRLRSRRRAPRRRLVALAPPSCVNVTTVLPRGGLLVAAALARRGPPTARAA